MCAICTSALEQPTSAACGHNFCLPCLREWVRAKQARLEVARCPLCRGPVAQDPARLGVNLVLQALLPPAPAAAADVGGNGGNGGSGGGGGGGGGGRGRAAYRPRRDR